MDLTIAGRDWEQEEKGKTEDEMAGWHHQLDGCKFEWTPGVGDGQGSLACRSPWGHKESDMTERLNWTEIVQITATPCRWLPYFKESLWLICEGYSRGSWAEAGKSIRRQLQESQQKTTLKPSGYPIQYFKSPVFTTCQHFLTPFPASSFSLTLSWSNTVYIFSLISLNVTLPD